MTGWSFVLRTCARIAGVLGVILAGSAHAMTAPDSLTLARIENLAGPSGHARLRVEHGGEWQTFKRATFDGAGIRGVPRAEVGSAMTEVWVASPPPVDLAWDVVTRLEVPGRRARSRSIAIGAVVGGLLALPAIGAVSEEVEVSRLAALAAVSVYSVVGGFVGAGLSAFNPWHGRRWQAFP
jgi:hypothetical protein